VALLDIGLPGRSGLDVATALHEELPGVRVLMLTTFNRPGYLRRAMEAGAAGFLLKDAPASELARAIRAAVAGERVVDPGLAAAALSQGENPLTTREREVLTEARRHGRWRSSPRPCTSRPEPLATTSRRSCRSSMPTAASRR
jgi:two-component system response regulator DesR